MLGEANLGEPNFATDVVGGVANLMEGVAGDCNPWQQGCARCVVKQSHDTDGQSQAYPLLSVSEVQPKIRVEAL